MMIKLLSFIYHTTYNLHHLEDRDNVALLAGTALLILGGRYFVYLNWFQCQGQFFDSNRYKITTVTGEKSVRTAWPPYQCRPCCAYNRGVFFFCRFTKSVAATGLLGSLYRIDKYHKGE